MHSSFALDFQIERVESEEAITNRYVLTLGYLEFVHLGNQNIARNKIHDVSVQSGKRAG